MLLICWVREVEVYIDLVLVQCRSYQRMFDMLMRQIGSNVGRLMWGWCLGGLFIHVVGIGMMVVFSVHVCGAPGFLTGMVGGGWGLFWECLQVGRSWIGKGLVLLMSALVSIDDHRVLSEQAEVICGIEFKGFKKSIHNYRHGDGIVEGNKTWIKYFTTLGVQWIGFWFQAYVQLKEKHKPN